MHEVQYSQARAEFADLHDQALAHLPTRVTRRRSEPAVLVSAEDFNAVLSRYEFHPEVLFEEDATSIWLPELAIWGRGDSFVAARQDLLDEVEQLLAVITTDERVRNAANMVARRPWIFRLMGTEEREWDGILFAQPTDGERSPASLAVSA